MFQAFDNYENSGPGLAEISHRYAEIYTVHSDYLVTRALVPKKKIDSEFCTAPPPQRES